MGYAISSTSFAYAASKAAATSLGRGLRAQLKPFNVGVSVVAPGFVQTPMTDVNRFSMPFLINDAEAAKIIYDGVEHDEPTIDFPLPMFLLAYLVAVFPAGVISAVYGTLIRDPGATR